MAHAALRFYPTLRDVPQRWVLVDAAPKILPEIPRGLGEYAARRLAERGVEIHVGTTLESYDGREAVLSDGTRIPAQTLVWTAGVRASPLLPELGLPLDDRGRVVVDETMRVQGNRATCGRSATAPRSSTRRRRASPTRRPASTRCARHDGSRRTSRASRSRTATGCSARSRRSAGSRARGDPRAPPLGLPRLVRDEDVPPVPAAAAHAEAPCRRRLDGRALLPSGHRRALDARPSAQARRTLSARPSGRLQRLLARRARRRQGRRRARRGRARLPS